MFNLNRGRRVSRMTILRVLLKSIFVTSSGRPRWQSILGVVALGLSVALGFSLFAPQQAAPAAIAPAAAPIAPAQASTRPLVEHTLVIRFKRSFTNGAYRALDVREDALQGTGVTTAVVSFAEFVNSLHNYGTLTTDEQSLERIFKANNVQRFVLTSGLDDFTIVTDGTENSADFVAALKANPLVVNAIAS